jgi:hypothetical protein
MKMCSVGAELFVQTDGQTDTTKVIVAFRNLVYVPKNGQLCVIFADYIK